VTDSLSPAERKRVVNELDGIAHTLNTVAVALDVADAGPAADILNGAAEKIAACCWLLSAPLRKPPAGR